MLLRLLGRSSHLSMTKMVENALRSSVNRILGSIPCCYIEALNFPGRPVLSFPFSHPSSSSQQFLTSNVSLWLLLKVFPRLFIGCFKIVGICDLEIEKQDLSKTLLFFNTNVLDFAGLKDIFAHPFRLQINENPPDLRS